MPRPRETSATVAGLGAAFGAVLAGPVGAALGGLIGGVAGTEALSLQESLRLKMVDKGLKFENLRRTSRFEIHVLYSDRQERFGSVIAKVPASSFSPDELDDALYDQAVAAIERMVVVAQTSPQQELPFERG